MTLVDAETGEIVETLEGCEQIIERGLGTFVEVGNALIAIRDGKLYRSGHDTFEAYCSSRWGLSRARAYQLIEAATIVDTVSTIVDTPVPKNEGQARALAPLKGNPEAMRDVMQSAASEGTITAERITEKVTERLASPRAEAIARYPWLDVPATTQQIVGAADALDKYTGAERVERIETSKKWAASVLRKLTAPPEVDRNALLDDIGAAYDALLAFNLAAQRAGFVLKDHPELIDADDADWVGAIASARNYLDDLTPVKKLRRIK